MMILEGLTPENVIECWRGTEINDTYVPKYTYIIMTRLSIT